MDALEVVVVVDNVPDALLASTEVARRPPAALDPQPDHLLAEHGYSLLLTVERAGSRQSILYDAGWSGHTAQHNLEWLGSKSMNCAPSPFPTDTVITTVGCPA